MNQKDAEDLKRFEGMANPQFQLKLSRKLQKICDRTNQLIAKEMGEECGVGIIVWPWAGQQSGFEDGQKVEFQYVSTAPRAFMFGCLQSLLDKWKTRADIPPHMRQ